MAEGRVVRILGVSRGLGIGTFMVGMAVVLAACGSSSTPIDDDDADGGRARPGAGDGGTGDGGIFGDPTPIPTADGGACSAVSQKSSLAPVNFVVLVDRSGSMGDSFNGKKAKKWDPTVAALKAFFNSPQANGTNASLAFFPKPDNYNTTTKPQCSAATYAGPAVAMTALPSAGFDGQLSTVLPEGGGGTPTDVALEATYTYAKEQQTAPTNKAGKTAVLLVTDGLPCEDTCGDTNCTGGASTTRLANVKAKAQAAAAGTPAIKTFVVGIRESTDPANYATILSEIAVAGGTTQAIPVDTGDANATNTALLAAIASIRGQSQSCDIPIPAPPTGQTFDRNKVNVTFKENGGAATDVILENEGCKDSGKGWQYDNATNPTKIMLCANTCTTVQSGELNVAFGCQTQRGTGGPR